MTYICDLNDCAFCNGVACRACDSQSLEPSTSCTHDPIERHCAYAAIEEDEEPVVNRVPTKPLDQALLAGKITIDLSDPDQAASFLELVARILRAKGKISVTVE